MSGKSGKGGEFEREICKRLSLWLTGGESDEGLWRSSNSGGRATGRRRRGERTTTHNGDIAATTARGAALLRRTCWELKTGYGRWSVQDEFDSVSRGCCRFTKFVAQAVGQCPLGKLPILVTRRLGGRAMVWLPISVLSGVPLNFPCMRVRCRCGAWHGMALEDFTKLDPDTFLRLVAANV